MTRRRPKRRSDEAVPLTETFAFKVSTKVFLGLAVILIFLTLVQCSIKKPESPSWNSKLTIPLVNRTYSMTEIIERIDQEGITVDSLGDVSFSFTQDLDTVSIDSSDFVTSNLSYSVSEVLGPITIDPPASQQIITNFTAIGPISGLITGGDAIIPMPIGFSISTNFTMSNKFAYAAVTSGSATVAIYNNLGITLDTLRMTFTDLSFGLIATYTHSIPILSGDTVSFLIDLANTDVSYQWQIATYAHTPGGVSTNVATRFIDVSVDFPSQFEVSSALAQIPSVSPITFSQPVALAETNRIDTAFLSSGTLDLTVTNNTNLDASLVLTIPDLELNGQPLVINQNLTGGIGTPQVVSVNLQNYLIIPSDNSVPQLLDINVIATIAGSGSVQVNVSETDSISVEATMSNLAFSRVTGLFTGIGASFDNITEDINVPTGFDDIQLQRAILSLEIHSGIDLPGTLNITLTGDAGQIINLSGPIVPAGDSISISTFEVVDSANFLAPIPSQITASGSVDFGDGTYVGAINLNDFVTAFITVTAPLEMIITASQIQTDIVSETIDTADIGVITEHLIEATFSYNITNKMPMGAQVVLYFSPDSATLYSNPALRLPKLGADSIFVPMAPIGPGGTTIDTISTGWVQISLDSTDAKILDNTVLYLGQELILEDSQGQIIKLNQSDFITIRGRIEVEFLFDGNL